MAGDATMLYYTMDEAQEGGKAFLEKRKPCLLYTSIGSLALCPGQIAVGINVSGTHVQAVSEGDTEIGRAHV